MTIDADTAPEIRLLRLDAEQWSGALERLRSDADTAAECSDLVRLLARHGDAPVRARVVAAAGDSGSITRVSIVGNEVLLILQATSGQGERTLVEPGAELRLCAPEALWQALQAGLPPVALLRAPAGYGVVREPVPDGTPSDDAPDIDDSTSPGRTSQDGLESLEGETAGLLVTVEAWPTPAEPAAVWMRRWSVGGDGLFDARRRDGVVTLVPRPLGSVAAEFEWALVGAIGRIAGDAEARDARSPSEGDMS